MRNFAVRPDLITHPLPQFSGQAALPSSVDLYINSYKTAPPTSIPGRSPPTACPTLMARVRPPSSPPTPSAARVSTTVPFYVASNPLQTGMSDFSISTGLLRRNLRVEFCRLRAMGRQRQLTLRRHRLVNPGRTRRRRSRVGGWRRRRRPSRRAMGVLNASYSVSQAGDEAFNGGRAIQSPPITIR